MAISGAAMVHLFSLLIFVGFMGTWLVSVIPQDVTKVVQTYILASVLGAVVVQAIVSLKQLRATIIAIVVSAAVVFLLVPAIPSLAFFSTAVAVIATAVLAWFLREKSARLVKDPEGTEPAEPRNR